MKKKKKKTIEHTMSEKTQVFINYINQSLVPFILAEPNQWANIRKSSNLTVFDLNGMEL